MEKRSQRHPHGSTGARPSSLNDLEPSAPPDSKDNVMNILVADKASDRYRIYLNDHRALLAAETALAQRSLDANDGELAHLLERIVRQTTTDQTTGRGTISRQCHE